MHIYYLLCVKTLFQELGTQKTSICDIYLGVFILTGEPNNKNVAIRRIPRWRLEEGSRKHASSSEILERRWRHTLQAKPPRRGKTLIPPHFQPA
jgi:hypothetical protein